MALLFVCLFHTPIHPFRDMREVSYSGVPLLLLFPSLSPRFVPQVVPLYPNSLSSSQSPVPCSLIAYYPMLVGLASLARVYCMCGCPCILRDAVSGYRPSSPSASPAFSSAWVSLRCLNCINSPVASRNFDNLPQVRVCLRV